MLILVTCPNIPHANVDALYLSTCLIYLVPYLLLLFPLERMHGVTITVTEIAIWLCACGVCGGSANSLLGNIVVIQRSEVNTKKCSIVKSSVILKETGDNTCSIRLQLAPNERDTPFKPALSHTPDSYAGKSFCTAVNDPYD